MTTANRTPFKQEDKSVSEKPTVQSRGEYLANTFTPTLKQRTKANVSVHKMRINPRIIAEQTAE